MTESTELLIWVMFVMLLLFIGIPSPFDTVAKITLGLLTICMFISITEEAFKDD